MNSLFYFILMLSNFANYDVPTVSVSGHAILTKPKSKNGGNFTTPSLPSSSYFGLASFGIIDKAFFDGDHRETPWTRPGEFDFYSAQTVVPGHSQLLHPCGCNAAVDVHHCDIATAGFGETTLGAVAGTPQRVTPPSWALGSTQETGWNAHTNHNGGYIYMLCKKTDYDECRDLSFPNGPLMATEEETNDYLECVWSCFESNTLEWADEPAATEDLSSFSSSQRLQYEDDECTYTMTEPQTKVGKDDHIWRTMPIPDTAQITNSGEGLCTWDAVVGFSNELAETKFVESFGDSDVCDTGPDAHNPQKWHIIDQVQVPPDIHTGEYLLSWRWDAYMADQMWTNCADVQIVQQTFSPSSQENQDDESLCSPPNSPIIPAPVSKCLDSTLPGNWGKDGRTCDTYEDLDGTMFCTHDVLKDSCCFCGGGDMIVTEEEEEEDSVLNDNDTWMVYLKNGKTKGCNWVKKRPDKRCNKKGKEVDEENGSIVQNGVRAKNACLKSCNGF